MTNKPAKELVGVKPETHNKLKYIVAVTDAKFIGTVVDELVDTEYSKVKSAVDAAEAKENAEETVL